MSWVSEASVLRTRGEIRWERLSKYPDLPEVSKNRNTDWI